MSTSICRLPSGDRAQRTADFRALFDGALVDRTRTDGRVRWTLRASDATDAESRRLASLETRCCDGIRFEVDRRGDHVIWAISGPTDASSLLDAFYDLPLLVRTDEGARSLWDSLDAAACGASGADRQTRSTVPIAT